MKYAGMRTQQETALAIALLKLWEEAHNTLAGNVRILVGRDSVAIWIEGALTPAEHAVARGSDGKSLVQRYVDELLAAIQPDLQAKVEEVTGYRIISGNAHVDIATGNILCFYVLGAPLTTPNTSATDT